MSNAKLSKYETGAKFLHAAMDSSPKKKNRKPSPRRDGREAALQFLFGHDIQSEIETSDDEIEKFWELRTAKSFARDFATELVKGTLKHRVEIDVLIKDALENFSFHRLTPVDRNILRLATYEIRYSDHIPPAAALNEAIEIAKRFGTEESPKFVNGILDTILNESSS